ARRKLPQGEPHVRAADPLALAGRDRCSSGARAARSGLCDAEAVRMSAGRRLAAVSAALARAALLLGSPASARKFRMSRPGASRPGSPTVGVPYGSFAKVKLTLGAPIPSLSPAGLAAAAALVVLAAGYALRRRLGTVDDHARAGAR